MRCAILLLWIEFLILENESNNKKIIKSNIRNILILENRHSFHFDKPLYVEWYTEFRTLGLVYTEPRRVQNVILRIKSQHLIQINKQPDNLNIY